MKPYLTPRQFASAAAIVLVVVVALIQNRRSEGSAVLTQLGHGEADALVGELARCRTVTPDDTGVLEACRRIWAENRQHFFLSTKSPPPPAAPTPDAPAEPINNQARSSLDGVERGRAR